MCDTPPADIGMLGAVRDPGMKVWGYESLVAGLNVVTFTEALEALPGSHPQEAARFVGTPVLTVTRKRNIEDLLVQVRNLACNWFAFPWPLSYVAIPSCSMQETGPASQLVMPVSEFERAVPCKSS